MFHVPCPASCFPHPASHFPHHSFFVLCCMSYIAYLTLHVLNYMSYVLDGMPDISHPTSCDLCSSYYIPHPINYNIHPPSYVPHPTSHRRPSHVLLHPASPCLMSHIPPRMSLVLRSTYFITCRTSWPGYLLSWEIYEIQVFFLINLFIQWSYIFQLYLIDQVKLN